MTGSTDTSTSAASQNPFDGRFAPSPTGDLHLGNLRTALAAWLCARAAGARFLVRIEDLDRERVVPGCAARQLEQLAAIGIDWDGEPAWQTRRSSLYDAALAKLEAQDMLYRCWCTRAEIREAASAPHGALPEGGYTGTCRRLSPPELQARANSGAEPCLRVAADGARVAFDDLLLGHVEAIVDDFVVVRKDGVPAYNLAVVVDDAEQGIGTVVRGADLAEGTPRQLWLAQALGLPAPRHAHVPLVLGPDGRRLSKRHGSVTIDEWLRDGHTIGELRAWLAGSLGIGRASESCDPYELVAAFDLHRVPRDPVVWRDEPRT